MSGRRRLSVVIASLAGIWLAAAILQARERAYPLADVPERLLYLRSGKTADRLMLTFDALAADVYWIRSIQSYGRDLKDRSRPDRFALVQPLLDLTTTLDPYFLIAYRFGAVFLALDPPHGPGRPDQAIQLLQKGLAADPSRWQLAHDIAFVHYFHTRNYAAAADWFERAAAMPHAPGWLGTLAAMTKAEGGNRQGARQILTDLLESPDAYIRSASQRMLEQLDALDRIEAAQKIVDDFNAAKGRFPSGWPELFQARLLPGIPIDPQRVPLAYDVVTGRVMLAPNSPLSPLPQGFRNR
jgi:tetratricopeptide (TPR) repeat protein